MKVDMMRRIDRGVGVPLSFITTPFAWLLDFLRQRPKGTIDVSRTLFIELSEMGSTIIADPAMRKLRSEGNAELYFAIFSKNYSSLKILNTIHPDRIFKVRSEGLFIMFWDVIRFFIWCRKNRITTTIDLELFSRFTALLSFLSGARWRIGFTNLHDEGLFRGDLINNAVRYNPHVHVAVNFMSLVNKALGHFQTEYSTYTVNPQELQLQQAEVAESSIERVREKIKTLYPQWDDEAIVLLNVNASDLLPQRRWPQENFSRVGKELLRQFPNTIILLTGAPGEKDYVERVARLVDNERCINTAGVFAFSELVPLYTISTLMLTNDSGPAHFAAVTPLKVFVLFGPETPALYLPIGGNAEAIYLGLPCSPCVSAANHRKTSCEARPCITGITPSSVTMRVSNFIRQAQLHSHSNPRMQTCLSK